MGLILTIDEIHEHMTQLNMLNDRTEKTLVYAQIMPTVGQFFLLGNYAHLLKAAYFAMALEEDHIILLPLGKFSGKINKKAEPIILPLTELEDIIIKEGVLQFSVTFLSEENELTVKMAKKAMGMKWHKENLEFVVSELRRFGTEVNVVGN